MYFCEAQRLPSTSPRSTQEHLAPGAQRTPHPLPSPMGPQDPESPRSHCWGPLRRVSPVPCPPRTTVSVALRAPVRGAEPRSCSQRRGGAQPSPRRHGASAQPPRVTASHFVMNRIVSARTARTRSMPRVSQVTCWRCIFRMGLIRAGMWPRSCLSRRRGEMIIKTMLDVPPVAPRPPRCSNTSHWEAAGVGCPRVTSSRGAWGWPHRGHGAGSAVAVPCSHSAGLGPAGTTAPVVPEPPQALPLCAGA